MILYRLVLILFIGWVFGEDKDVFISREIILISRSDWICLVRIFVYIYININNNDNNNSNNSNNNTCIIILLILKNRCSW